MILNIKHKLENIESPIDELLQHRGLSKCWLKANEQDLHNGNLLLNFEKAVKFIDEILIKKPVVGIIVDMDMDGACSSSIIYNWLKIKCPTLDIRLIIPEGKVHGIIEEIIPTDIEYLIIPDASSSEVEKHKSLYNKNIKILILDHHIIEQYGSPAIIVNPHHEDCKYPNKDLSGGGVVFKFISAYDEHYGSHDYEIFFDLAAASIVADGMSLKSLENKAIVNIGLTRIVNPMFKAYFIVDKRAQNKSVDAILIGYYFAPIINAIIRMGTVEDKMLMMKAFIGEADAVQAMSSMVSLKGKQDNNKDKIIPLLVYGLQKNKTDNENVIIATAPSTLFASSTGLVAGNLSSQYFRPVLLGRNKDEDFVGSVRVPNDCNINNFKDFCNESGLFNWAAGHQSAFGFSLPQKNIELFKKYCAEQLPAIEHCYQADYSLVGFTSEEKAKIITAFSELNIHIGNDFSPIVLHDKICVHPSDIAIIGQNANTVKICHEGVVYIQFKQKNFQIPTTPVEIEIVGKPNLNEWQGEFTPQLFIENMVITPIENQVNNYDFL